MNGISDLLEAAKRLPKEMGMNNRPQHWMPRHGDPVDYHSIIGGEVTSRSHIVTHVTTDAAGQAVAWLTGGESPPPRGCVSCDALTPCDMSGISLPAGTEKKDWEARFLLVKAKVDRLVKGYKPPAAVVGGEKLWGEIKSLQDDITVLLDEKGTDHE